MNRAHFALTTVLCAGSALAAEPRVCAIPGSPAIEFIAESRIAGTATDKSGLEGKDRSGVAENLLGSWGSGIDVVRAELKENIISGELIAICDRGPFDGASSFACRVQHLAFTLSLPAKGSSEVPSLVLSNTQTDMLKAGETSLVGSLDAVAPTLDVPTWNFAGVKAEGKQPSTLSPARLDPESIRLSPAALESAGIAAGTWFVSDEYGPWIDLFSPVAAKGDSHTSHAQLQRRLLLPARYNVQHPGATYDAEMPPANTTGRMPNRGLESLAISPDGTKLFAMTQSPLLQDGLLEGTKRVGINMRLLVIDLTKLAKDGTVQPGATREYVYQLSHRGNGVNELLMWDDNTLLVLERCSNKGEKAKKRMLYAIDLKQLESGASDVSQVETLPTTELPAGVTPLAKQPWLDMLEPSLGLRGPTMPEKIEGIAKGPALPDGRRLLLESADNDLLPDQDNVVWAFAVDSAIVAMP